MPAAECVDFGSFGSEGYSYGVGACAIEYRRRLKIAWFVHLVPDAS